MIIKLCIKIHIDVHINILVTIYVDIDTDIDIDSHEYKDLTISMHTFVHCEFDLFIEDKQLNDKNRCLDLKCNSENMFTIKSS